MATVPTKLKTRKKESYARLLQRANDTIRECQLEIGRLRGLVFVKNTRKLRQ